MADQKNERGVDDLVAAQEFGPQEALLLRHLVRQIPSDRRKLEQKAAESGSELKGEIPADQVEIRLCAFSWALGDSGAPGRREDGLSLFLRGLDRLEAGEPEKAAGLFEESAKKLPHSPLPLAYQATALREAGEVERARKLLERGEKKFVESAAIYCEQGCYAQTQGDRDGALDLYDKSLSFDATYAPSAFRAGCLLDLYGMDDQAVELYKRCTEKTNAYGAAFINLGLLYDDRGDYERAAACYKAVLDAMPSNDRARLLMKCSIASMEEQVESPERTMSERLEQLLRRPVTDFELSIRSRNCLQRVGIATLGDLVKKTEHELLAIKNFGQTSLREINRLLGSKGLKLGMGSDEDQKMWRRERLKLVLKEGGDSSVLDKPVSELDLSVRARKCLARLDIKAVGEIATRTEEELLAVKNFGITSLNEIKRRLAELGISLRSAKSEFSG